MHGMALSTLALRTEYWNNGKALYASTHQGTAARLTNVLQNAADNEVPASSHIHASTSLYCGAGAAGAPQLDRAGPHDPDNGKQAQEENKKHNHGATVKRHATPQHQGQEMERGSGKTKWWPPSHVTKQDPQRYWTTRAHCNNQKRRGTHHLSWHPTGQGMDPMCPHRTRPCCHCRYHCRPRCHRARAREPGACRPPVPGPAGSTPRQQPGRRPQRPGAPRVVCPSHPPRPGRGCGWSPWKWREVLQAMPRGRRSLIMQGVGGGVQRGRAHLRRVINEGGGWGRRDADGCRNETLRMVGPCEALGPRQDGNHNENEVQ